MENGVKMNGDNFDREKDLEKMKQYIEQSKERKRLKKQALREKLKPDIIFILLFSAYIIVNTINVYRFRTDIYDVEINADIGIIYFLGTLTGIFAVFMAAYLILWKIKNLHRYILFFSSVIFAISLVANRNLNIAYNITVLAVLFYIINYCFHRKDEPDAQGNAGNSGVGINFDRLDNLIGSKLLMILTAIMVLAFTAVMGEACIVRYLAFRSSTYDFGIFAQMFENMAKTGMQITSVERNMQLSHFAVHFSPVYYLILPFYMIFRSPESLLVIQALAVGAGAFPIALIAKKYNFSQTNTLFIVIAYLFYPALSGGLFFDFHENKFLTVLILWLLYFIASVSSVGHDYSNEYVKNYIKKYLRLRYILIYVFALLVLTVKEDSFIYVFFIALYMISLKKDGRFVKKNILHGTIIAGLSLLYFLFSTYCLSFGEGAMTWRFDLFLRIGEDGFFAMILNVLKNPALLLASLLSVPQKLEFIYYMLIPLCFLPFFSKKLNFILLIIPMVIINLATDYIYQYDVHFQYTYGATALLFFLAIQNLSKINLKHITKICVTMACFAVILFMSKNFNRIHSYNFIYFNFREDFIEAEEIIKQIPMDAAISSSPYLVPHLIKREKIYNVEVGTEDFFDYGTEYLLIDLRDVEMDLYRRFLKEIDDKGYKKTDAGVFIEVFRKADKIQDTGDNGGG